MKLTISWTFFCIMSMFFVLAFMTCANWAKYLFMTEHQKMTMRIYL